MTFNNLHFNKRHTVHCSTLTETILTDKNLVFIHNNLKKFNRNIDIPKFLKTDYSPHDIFIIYDKKLGELEVIVGHLSLVTGPAKKFTKIVDYKFVCIPSNMKLTNFKKLASLSDIDYSASHPLFVAFSVADADNTVKHLHPITLVADSR
jgi:5-bromo-4-chloroindolyl phosphate hydrolysis protein